MRATAFDFEEPSDPAAAVSSRVNAREEDAYWERCYWREGYYEPGLDYEDYAPAYCVGYIGYAQYGGAFEDAEVWMCANWMRIKGDSRLTLDQARLAMRSAWDRLAHRPQPAKAAWRRLAVGLLRHRLRIPAFKLSPRLVR